MKTELAQGCYIHQGTIPAATGTAGSLRDFDLVLPATKPYRKFYAAVVVDDVRSAYLEGTFDFTLQGNPVLSIPVRANYYATGWGQVNAPNIGEQVGVLPSFNVTRLENDSNGGFFSLPIGEAQVGIDLLQKSFLYQDDAGSGWVYRVLMAPFRVEVVADRLSWTPRNFYGLANLAATTTLCAVIAACVSDE